VAPAGAMLDIVTIGRSCVGLYGEQVGGRLEDMASLRSISGAAQQTRRSELRAWDCIRLIRTD
jgi:hypothetical protein